MAAPAERRLPHRRRPRARPPRGRARANLLRGAAAPARSLPLRVHAASCASCRAATPSPIPMLTLGNRFADNEDMLLSTYLHEQMHWYLWHLGTPERDTVAPFFDELVRRYPDAPDDAARRRAQLRGDLFAPGRQLAGGGRHLRADRPPACLRAWPRRSHSYRWIYRTVLQRLGHAGRAVRAPRPGPHPQRAECSGEAQRQALRKRARSTAALEKCPQQRARPAPPRSRHRPPARGGRSAG